MGLSGKIEPLLSRSLQEDDMYAIFNKQRVSPAFVTRFSHALHRPQGHARQLRGQGPPWNLLQR
jgi:hypothetical protein